MIAKIATMINCTHAQYAQNDANYPSSPDCKRCELGVAYSSGICSVEAKAISSPPGKYGRKAET